MSELEGYRGQALEVLKKANVSIGDVVKIQRDGETYEGILIPRSEYADDEHILIKLKNGYNTGIRVLGTTRVVKLGEGVKPAFVTPATPQGKPDLPKVSIISTGGTIACRVDYRSGAVHPALSAEDLYSVVPELSDVANIQTEILFHVFSENMTPQHWTEIARKVAEHIQRGARGVVVTHGTDTMGYTSAALSFAMQGLPVPVVLVGSQRSSDRPSSDAASNLLGSVSIAANAPFAEVALVMHEKNSDDYLLAHRGTKVRKCHSSARDAFQSINSDPIARYHIQTGEVEMLQQEFRRRDPERTLDLRATFSGKAGLVKFYPGVDPGIIDWYRQEGYRGIILEGSGLGHVSKACYEPIKKAVEDGMFVGMTSQCLWGRVNMNVYYTGRDLQALGVTPLHDMLPETALVKLMWAVSQTTDAGKVRETMLTDIAYEFGSKRLPKE